MNSRASAVTATTATTIGIAITPLPVAWALNHPPSSTLRLSCDLEGERFAEVRMPRPYLWKYTVATANRMLYTLAYEQFHVI
jgi:hypothetical protein